VGPNPKSKGRSLKAKVSFYYECQDYESCDARFRIINPEQKGKSIYFNTLTRIPHYRFIMRGKRAINQRLLFEIRSSATDTEEKVAKHLI